MIKRILRPFAHWLQLKNNSRDRHTVVENINASNESLIYPAAAPGGLGDDAMVNGALHALDDLKSEKNVSILGPADWATSFEFNSNSQSLALTSPWIDPLTEVNNAIDYSNVYILGADILDGAHNLPDAVKRIQMAKYYSERGRHARLIGFSFNASPNPHVIEQFKKLKNVPLYLRDSNSFERMKAIFDGEMHLAADIAFLLQPSISSTTERVRGFSESQAECGKRVIGVNIHSMFEKFSGKEVLQNLIKSIANLIEKQKDCSFVLIPHDYREISDDRVPLKAIYENLSKECKNRVLYVDTPMRASEIKGLCRYLDGVFTGRMHLAIAALGMKVPVFGIVYQGKFEGTFAHFGLDASYSITPEKAATPEILVKSFAEWLNKFDETKILIDSKIEHVLQLALLNFK